MPPSLLGQMHADVYTNFGLVSALTASQCVIYVTGKLRKGGRNSERDYCALHIVLFYGPGSVVDFA